MRILKGNFGSQGDSYYQAITLVTLTVAGWLAFFLVAINTSMYGGGQCLHTSWLPEGSPWLSPYWLFVALVSGLSLFSIALLIDGIASGNRVNQVVGVSAALVLAIWLFGLNGLWRAMQYERGELSAEEWFSSRILDDRDWYRELGFFQPCGQR